MEELRISMEKEKTEQRGYQPFNNIGKFGYQPAKNDQKTKQSDATQKGTIPPKGSNSEDA